MKAISILQPWSWLIVRPDLQAGPDRAAAVAAGLIKDIENRNWQTSFRGRVLIHAGKKWGPEQREDVERVRKMFPEIDLPDRFDLGGIVGAATMVDCVSYSPSRWFFGSFGFVLADSVPCPFIPYRGQLNFFDVPRSALDTIFPREHDCRHATADQPSG